MAAAGHRRQRPAAAEVDAFLEALAEAEPDATPAAARAAPNPAMRLVSAGCIAFLKGAVVSAVVVAPFFGIGAAFASALAFCAFCTWLAWRKGPGVGPVADAHEVEIRNPDSCYPQVRR